MSVAYSNIITTSTLPAGTGVYWGDAYFGPSYFGSSYWGTTPGTPTPTPTGTLHGFPLVSRVPSLTISRTASITINDDMPYSLDILGNNVYFSCVDGDTFEIVVIQTNVFGVSTSSRVFRGVAHEGLVI